MAFLSVKGMLVCVGSPVEGRGGRNGEVGSVILVLIAEEIGILGCEGANIILKPFFVIFEHSNYQLINTILS